MNQIDLNSYLGGMSALPRSTTILREEGLRALLLHLASGEEIPEHQSRGAITVHCLIGRVTFFRGDEPADLKPGVLISLPAGANHKLKAAEDSLLLVTLSEAVAARP